MEKKIARIREDIAQLKKNEEIANLLTLFKDKGEMQTLDDFEVDNPGCIWHYFYRVSRELGFPPNTMNRLFSDVRDIAIQIMDNPPNDIYNIIMRVGKYDPELTGYEGGYPKREQHAWHMLLWFFAESKSGIIDAIVRRMVRLCSTSEEGLLPYHDEMKIRLTEQEPIPVEEQEEQLPPEVEKILSLKGQENATFIKKRLECMAPDIKFKSDYLFVELVLDHLGYIKEECEHTSFIKALEAWRIIEKGYIKANNLTNKFSRDLHSDVTRKLWDDKSIRKFDRFVEWFRKPL